MNKGLSLRKPLGQTSEQYGRTAPVLSFPSPQHSTTRQLRCLQRLGLGQRDTGERFKYNRPNISQLHKNPKQPMNITGTTLNSSLSFYMGVALKYTHFNNGFVLNHTLSVFLSCFSKMVKLSFRIFTISAGFLCDLLNKGIFFMSKDLFFQYGMLNKQRNKNKPS